jgi:hypothetical protein
VEAKPVTLTLSPGQDRAASHVSSWTHSFNARAGIGDIFKGRDDSTILHKLDLCEGVSTSIEDAISLLCSLTNADLHFGDDTFDHDGLPPLTKSQKKRLFEGLEKFDVIKSHPEGWEFCHGMFRDAEHTFDTVYDHIRDAFAFAQGTRFLIIYMPLRCNCVFSLFHFVEAPAEAPETVRLRHRAPNSTEPHCTRPH